MKRKYYALMFILATLVVAGTAQTRITLEEGDDLITVIADANAGDTIAIEPGFHVASYSNVLVEKSIAIISTDKDVKPNVYIKQFDVQGTDLNLLFEGINFSSATVDSVTRTEDTTTLISADSYFINLTSSHVSINDLTIKNCVVRNFGRAMLRGDRSANTVANIVVDGCVMYDQRGAGDYGVFRTKSNIDIGTFTIKNSTFYAITNRFIDLESAPGSPMITIQNCTFHRWGGGKSGQYLFDFKSNGAGSLKITSCIFGKTNDNELVTVNGFRMLEGGYMEMTNTCMAPDFILTTGDYASAPWNKTEYNLEDTDPGFADPLNGDFTLPEESDLLQWSPEGTIIGDPRWSPLPPVSARYNEMPDPVIYPNPANGYFFISLEVPTSVDIYSVTGRIVKQFEQVDKSTVLSISDLQPGIYFIKMKGGSENRSKLLIH
jgi:hypothetical protein